MPTDPPLADELSAAYERMSGLLLSDETVKSALSLITSLAHDSMPGAVGAGVTLLDERGRKTTAAASDPVVERADNLQYELDEGPCLTAWTSRAPIRVDRISAEPRWPRWARTAGALGLQSSLSVPLVVGDACPGALKVYADQPSAFDARAEQLLTRFATQAAILVANVQSFRDAHRLTDQLKDALRNRDVIATAKGILMARAGTDEESAFAMLVAASQRENQKLRDVAQAVVASTSRRRG